MLPLTCRDFQVEFWSFPLRNCLRCEEIWINMLLPYMVNVQNSDRSLFHWHISCTSLQLHVKPCMLHCVLMDCNGTKWTGNVLSIPTAACSQQLFRGNKLPTGCYFFSFLVFSPYDMNVFVKDLTVDNAVTHVQGFSSGIFIFFEILCVQYEGIWNNVWLPCTVDMQHSAVFFTDFSLKQEVFRKKTEVFV